MFFSDYFHVDSELIKEYGAVDVSLICDIPYFVDPMLIFNSEKNEYIQLHENIIKYFHFLYKKSKQNLNEKEILAWFSFNEVPNNWLGYSLSGNSGLALGKKFAIFLHNNISFALETNGISKSAHIEKVLLIYEGSGKDKISDLTVNLIKEYLCEFTEKFAKKYINPEQCCDIPVEKAYFNYETESFVSKEYYLPCITTASGKKEYVLLTPYDILREEEPSINKEHFYKSHERIRDSISNEELRAYVNNYIAQAVKAYERKQKEHNKKVNELSIEKIERNAFKELVKECPELYDYYIKLQESNSDEIREQSFEEFSRVYERINASSKRLLSLLENEKYTYVEACSAHEETKNRLKFLKHIIEDCDGYKILYHDGVAIAKESDLQRLFRLVWYGTNYKVDAEANNGRGQADFVISYGFKNQNAVEFKLASNSTLSHVFTQVEIYEAANCSTETLIAIFYFSEFEYEKAVRIIREANQEQNIGESIFLIDCRADNKPSASIA